METRDTAAFEGDLSMVLAGQAGQGLQTIEYIISRSLRDAGYHVFSTSEVMSRIRGGSNSTLIRLSSRPVAAFVDRVDILLPLESAALDHVASRLGPQTLILGERGLLATARQVVDLPFTSIAVEAGSRLMVSSVVVGVIAGIVGLDLALVEPHIRRHFEGKPAGVVERNLGAAGRGLEEGRRAARENGIVVRIDREPAATGYWIMNGSEAVGLGALAGGCDFISSYPMSPGTGVLQFLASRKNGFGLVVDQAEDEIAAANMAQGAWYAGARALVTTSGGGFALMTETVSLAGMIETPLVVHVGQRPGPATGLPTRTEQGDLELVLHAGHGDVPRAIYAPGTVEEAFALTRRAFDTADRFQVPAFILSDQFLLDSTWSSPPFAIPGSPPHKHLIETMPGYLRYAESPGGISPRGVPGYGTGIVRVDSDEHDEEGLITEDGRVRIRMVDKRLGKLAFLVADALPPTLIGTRNPEVIILAWGSTLGVASEAVAALGRSDVSLLHVSQVWPLHPAIATTLGKAPLAIAVENNATGQFARLVQAETGVRVHESILKYDGSPFSVEGLAERLRAAIAGRPVALQRIPA